MHLEGQKDVITSQELHKDIVKKFYGGFIPNVYKLLRTNKNMWYLKIMYICNVINQRIINIVEPNPTLQQ